MKLIKRQETISVWAGTLMPSGWVHGRAIRRLLPGWALILTLLILGQTGNAQGVTFNISAGPVRVETMIKGLDQPWGLAFLPGGGALITERGGKLWRLTPEGELVRVSGAPNVDARGQGGLLDIMVPRDFARTRQIFLSYSKKQGRGAGTAVAVARLAEDGRSLSQLRTIFEMSPGSSGGRHFGSRIVEAADGTLFVTIGERGDPDAAQNLARHNGSIIRIARDGSIPADNPFRQSNNALPEIWSYGHRNPQGAALDHSGQLWAVEHGAKGGDEINLIKHGANYGWPVIAFGRHYSGAKIGEGTAKAGMEQPAHYWDPSIAPSGLMIYSGKLWPRWRGHFFVGSLKFGYLSRLDPGAGWAEEIIRNNTTKRLRDVREAPDGSIWYLSVGKGALYRMTPG